MLVSAGLVIQGQTRCLGILGSGIGHSLSPLIHNFSSRYLGLDCVYLPFDSQSRQFPAAEFFAALWDMGAVGFNVTVPFKTDAARLFSVAGLCSINTIYRGAETWEACSTDAEGFLHGLGRLQMKLADFASIILLGNGGAALALYEHFLQMSEVPICVLRRNPEHDRTWQRPLGRTTFADLSMQSLLDKIVEHPKSLLIQTTSAPLHGDRLDYLAPALKNLQGAFVDLVYGASSALLDSARALGLPNQDGLPMLIGQALLAQQLWWKKSAPYAEVEKRLRLHLQQKAAGGV